MLFREGLGLGVATAKLSPERRNDEVTGALSLPKSWPVDLPSGQEERPSSSRKLWISYLVVSGHARCAAVLQDFDRCLGALVLGSDQQELPTMRESHCVRVDNFVGQAIVGQMGLKGPNDRLMIWLTMRGCFGRSPNRRRSGTWSEDEPETMRFSSIIPSSKTVSSKPARAKRVTA
jgi:hypothetical protein